MARRIFFSASNGGRICSLRNYNCEKFCFVWFSCSPKGVDATYICGVLVTQFSVFRTDRKGITTYKIIFRKEKSIISASFANDKSHLNEQIGGYISILFPQNQNLLANKNLALMTR